MTIVRVLCVALSLLTVTRSSADDPLPLKEQLQPFRGLLNKTWKATFPNSTPEKPVVDVMRWERALNGNGVRTLHSINDGVYGGETIFRWDDKDKAVTYHYFTTAGFMTVGKVTFDNGKWITHEVVAGSAGGISEVRGTSELQPDGTFKVKTEYMKDGQWQPGREVTYTEAPDAKVVFK